MKFNKTASGFLAGAIATGAVLTVSPALAKTTLENINVLMGGISIYKDDVIQIPMNANGDVVSPLVFEGTTYLPVRALVDILLPGTDILWDQDAYSIYLGDHTAGSQSTPINLISAYSGASNVVTGDKAKYSVMGEEFSPFNRFYYYDNDNVDYKLDSKYTSISGTLVIPYSSITTKNASGFGFYSVDRYGEETLIKEIFIKTGDEPVDFTVNILGCDYLKIKGLAGDPSDIAAGYTRYSTSYLVNVTIES